VSTLVQVHGALFTAWTALLVTQTIRIAAHRADLHRRVGLASVALPLTKPFVLAAILYDLRTRRRVHPVYVRGGALVLVSGPVRIGDTAPWQALARVLIG
jgi:hypothetical protein